MLSFPRRTARLRLTALYGGLFLASGVALVAATYLLFQHETAFRSPQLPKVPQTPSIQPLPQKPQLPQALFELTQAQSRLARDQNQLKRLPTRTGLSLRPPGAFSSLLSRDEHQLTQDQHRLARAVHQLAQAVHQVARAGSTQAAQRASDSHQLLVDSGIALGIVGVFALLAGWLVSGRMLRPIRKITATARRISSTSLYERLALDGPQDELKELGDTLDDLFGRLEEAFEAQRRFVAHASHELRTPLTRERALVQVALGDSSTPDLWRSTGRELLASNRGQEALIDALLTLASSEGGLDRRAPVDLADIARSRVGNHRGGDRLGLSVETAFDPAPLEGDPRLLERLVANLVDNAVTHNVEGGRIGVSTGSRDDRAVLTVTNTGPVVPPRELERLFQPFQRLDPERTDHSDGHGLGLSIVRAVATAHGATVTTQAPPEGGMVVEVVFPPLVGLSAGRPTDEPLAARSD